MDATEVMRELESLGTEQYRKTYRRHGAVGAVFGVSFANLKAIAKRLKTDHALATALWDSGNFDARGLAAMVADPAALTSAEADRWARGVDCYPSADSLATLVARSPVARKKAAAWRTSKNDWIGQTGWTVEARLALADAGLDDAYFGERLAEIRAGIHSARNRTRHAMNNALIAIGGRNASLRKKALDAAKVIGKVEVDHGETDCKTPDAAAYIHKMAARSRR